MGRTGQITLMNKRNFLSVKKAVEGVTQGRVHDGVCPGGKEVVSLEEEETESGPDKISTGKVSREDGSGGRDQAG